MAMKSLKRTPRERRIEDDETPAVKDEYPFGLRLSFDEEVLADLSLSANDFSIGQEFDTKVRLRVESLSQYSSDEHSSESVGLVLTAIDTQGADTANQAARMFGDADKES